MTIATRPDDISAVAPDCAISNNGFRGAGAPNGGRFYIVVSGRAGRRRLLEKTADEVTAELVDWVAAAAPGVPVNAPALTSPLRKAGFDVRLARVTPKPSARTSLAIDLDYLVTVQLADADAEHHALTELMFAAMARPDLEVLGADEAARVSAQYGLPLAPGFVLRTALLRKREAERVEAPAHHPASVTAAKPVSRLGAIRGRVIGIDGGPLEGVSIESPGRDGRVLTDCAGRFRIDDAGPEGAAVRLVARRQDAEVEAVAVAGLPMTLRLPVPTAAGGSAVVS